MGKETNAADDIESLPELDITPAERDRMIADTLKSLQEAFADTSDADDADTVTKLHQDAAEAASDPTESSS